MNHLSMTVMESKVYYMKKIKVGKIVKTYEKKKDVRTLIGIALPS